MRAARLPGFTGETPAGVPVMMDVPGCSVYMAEVNSISRSTL